MKNNLYWLFGLSILLILASCQAGLTPVQLSNANSPPSGLSSMVTGAPINHFELKVSDQQQLGQEQVKKLIPKQRRRQKKISGQVVTGIVLFGLGLLLIIFGGDDLYLPGTIMTLVGAGFVLFGLI